MTCTNEIHDELKSMEECTCPFCDQQLAEFKKWLSHVVMNKI